MIQRKQSIWLLLAALSGSGVLYFNLYKAAGAAGSADTVVRTMDHYPSLIIALVMIILPLVTIFMFGDRKRQKAMTIVAILADIAFIAMVLYRVSLLGKLTPPPAAGSFGAGAILPAFSLVLLVLAYMGIRSDDKLVKSMDRLR